MLSTRSLLITIVLLVVGLIGKVSAQSSQIFSTPGDFTWTVPPCVTQITVQVWGAGGGGGSVWSRFNSVSGNGSNCETGDEICATAGGGGGGGFTSRTYTVVPGEVYNITVGAGGIASVLGTGDNRAQNGGDGGISRFSGPATVGPGTLTGNGGIGGGAANIMRSCNFGCSFNHNGVNGAGGGGGNGVNGTTMYTGGNGAAGVHSTSTNDKSGGGGGGAGTGANGTNGGIIAAGIGGAADGGNGGSGINQPYGNGYFGTNGNPGTLIGGGGGGAASHNRNSCNSSGNNHQSRVGGNGARGEVRIIYITPNLPTPNFAAIAPICSGDNLSPLPTTSQNGYTGIWSPALNNTATTTYTFTPGSDQCANTTTLTITVDPPSNVPTFNQVGPVCIGGTIAALPTTSLNGISGTWSPALNNSATTFYTFTPNGGQCATTATMTITVTPAANVPAFSQVPAICTGTTLSPLPTTSNNGITGTWSPSMNNMATTTYTFTPNADQCATTASMTITVNQPTVPAFTSVAQICTGASISPLPTTSNNNINGSWSPALNSSATTTYTFIPASGQCASSTTMTISVSLPVTVTFSPLQPVCEGTIVSPLPLTSTEGVSGSWSPAFNNMATTTYTFTPNSGQCASNGTLSVVVNASIVPQFQQMLPICSGETLSPMAAVSDNGITGAWSPSLNNVATTTYTFTPLNGQCATSVDMTITVNSPSTMPTFPIIGTLCLGSLPPVLNSVSINGISGTWSSQVSTAVSGAQTYTFTPDPGECGVPTSIDVIVADPLTPVFNPLQDICQNDLAPALSNTSTNGISGVWSSQINSAVIGVQTMNFTPDNDQCALSTSVSLTINALPIVNAGNDAVLCVGEQITINATGANTYTWSNGLSNGLSMAPAVGTNTYSVTGTDLNGCSSSDQLIIIVNPLPTVYAGSDQTICQGASITLSGSGALSYTWDNGVVNGQQFTPSSGILVYTVEGMDQNGCIGTDQVSINVIPTPVSNFQVIGSGCVPLTITLQNSTPNATSCEWMISNGDVLSGCNTVTTDLLQAGCYDVTLTTEVNGCTASFTAVDIVCAEDAPDADFRFSPHQITTLDTEVEFQNLSSGAYSYIWDFGDNSVQSSEVDPVHEYSDDTYGNYEVMLVAYSQSGCSDTAFAFVKIEEELVFWVPNTFTPDDDNHNQTFDPVFTSGFDPDNYQLTIFNRWGEIVFESHDHEIGWNGTYGSVSGGEIFKCQDGTYTWKIKFKARTNDEQIVAIGHVNLVR